VATVTRLRLIGVPSSAGAHAPGVERGPARLLAVGLAESLAAAGVAAFDAGDLPVSLENLEALLLTGVNVTAGNAPARLHHEVELQQLAGRVIRRGVEDEPLPRDRVVQNLSAVTHRNLL
jgi:hypothetical protein